MGVGERVVIIRFARCPGPPAPFLVVLPLMPAEIATSRPWNCFTCKTTCPLLSGEPKIVECGHGYYELFRAEKFYFGELACSPVERATRANTPIYALARAGFST